LPDKSGVAPTAHGRVQVDDVKQRIFSKPVQQTKNVFDREPQFAAVDQLYRAAILEVDAGDNQCQSV
jgi:predicted kinase